MMMRVESSPNNNESTPPPKFGFHKSNLFQLSLHFLLAVLIGVSLRLTTFKEATAISLSNKYVWKTSFLVSFGFTKAFSNLIVGRVSDVYGRQIPHAIGWGFGIFLGLALLGLASATTSTNNNHTLWATYILANVCLGAQQGWTWTTNIFMWMDILGPHNRALASALSNSVGYLTSAFTTYAAAALSTEVAFQLVLASSVVGFLVSTFLVQDTIPYVAQEVKTTNPYAKVAMQEMVECRSNNHNKCEKEEGNTIYNEKFNTEEEESQDQVFYSNTADPIQASSFASVFRKTCWQNPSAAVLCWGGLMANLVTSLAWGLVLIWGEQQQLSSLALANIGSAFTFSKGLAMLVSGYLSDRQDRRKPVLVGGFLVAALGLLVTATADTTTSTIEDIYTRLCLGGVVIGFGIGSVYCVLTAGLSDHTPPQDRASAIGVYKLWRDSGYAFGGLLTGWIADASSFVTTTTVVAGLVLALVLCLLGLYKEVSRNSTTAFESIPGQENP